MPSQGEKPPVRVLTQVKREYARKFRVTPLKEMAARIVAGELPGRAADIGLIFTDDETLQRLNRDYRAIDLPTDVLSFPMQDVEGESVFITAPEEVPQLGDVIISLPRAVEQSGEYGATLEEELARLVAHGVLHILGYDHEAEHDAARMREKEEAALASLPPRSQTTSL